MLSSVNRPLAGRLPVAPPGRQHRRVVGEIILRPVVDVIVERPRAELILLALLKYDDIFPRIRHRQRKVPDPELGRLGRILRELSGELVEPVQLPDADKPVDPVRVTDRKDLLDVREGRVNVLKHGEVRAHPGLVLSVAVVLERQLTRDRARDAVGGHDDITVAEELDGRRDERVRVSVGRGVRPDETVGVRHRVLMAAFGQARHDREGDADRGDDIRREAGLADGPLRGDVHAREVVRAVRKDESTGEILPPHGILPGTREIPLPGEDRLAPMRIGVGRLGLSLGQRGYQTEIAPFLSVLRRFRRGVGHQNADEGDGYDARHERRALPGRT